MKKRPTPETSCCSYSSIGNALRWRRVFSTSSSNSGATEAIGNGT